MDFLNEPLPAVSCALLLAGGEVLPVSWRTPNEDAEDAHFAACRVQVPALTAPPQFCNGQNQYLWAALKKSFSM